MTRARRAQPDARASRRAPRPPASRRHDRDQLALVGQIERIEPEDLADALHGRRASASASSSHLGSPTPEAAANSFSTVATPPRVASRRQRMPGTRVAASRRPGRAAARQSLSIVGLQRQVAAREQDRGAVVAERAVDDHHVARPRTAAAEISTPARITPMPAVLMNSLSQAPRSHDLGVAGDDRDAAPRAPRAPCDAATRAQHVERAALPRCTTRAGQVQRPRAADREIVDRAAHRQLADVAAREEQRVDDVGVGGEAPAGRRARASSSEVEPRLVLQRRRAAGCRRRDEHVARSGRASPCRRRRARA